MQGRRQEIARVLALLADRPVVAILGPRQVGKTTLARAVAKAWKGPRHLFDLERRRHATQLREAEFVLERLRGLVVLDEVQRQPDLFAALRPLADRPGDPARFLVLGSASPSLLRQASESLVGRIAYVDLEGLGLADVGAAAWDRLWLRGGYPRSYLARSVSGSFTWRRDRVRTYLERDLPELGIRIPSATLDRFWRMVAHYHGQIWNGAELARAFAIGEATVRRYLDVLQATYMVRVLPAWSEDIGKRVVKSPKVYVKDSGILHELLDVRDAPSLQGHPKVGASFEGFALGETIRLLGAAPRECHFWATHQGAELDLLVVRGKRRLGFEFKHTSAPEVTKSMRIALEDLGLESLDVIHAGDDTYPLAPKVRAVSIARLTKDVGRLR